MELSGIQEFVVPYTAGGLKQIMVCYVYMLVIVEKWCGNMCERSGCPIIPLGHDSSEKRLDRQSAREFLLIVQHDLFQEITSKPIFVMASCTTSGATFPS